MKAGSQEKPISEFRPLGGVVKDSDVGMRVDRYLVENFPFYSRQEWQGKILEGSVRVTRGPLKPSHRVRMGDAFYLHHPHQNEPEVDGEIFPIWKSGGVMAFYKPGNLPMHENGPYRKNTFAHILRQEFGGEWAAVHRIDRETSGIVLCGNTPELRKSLALSLRRRTVQKKYLAIARGVPPANSWRELGPIGDLLPSKIRIKKWVVPDGLPSETSFRVLDSIGDKVLLEARPKTGRTNQIRIHAAYNGLPLLGDKLYHPDEGVFLEFFENRGNTSNIVEKVGGHRLCLHASFISFTHPETGEISEVECPLPEDMQKYWN